VNNIKSIILGSLLGDSSLTKVKSKNSINYRIDFGHGQKQLPYLLWKRELLSCNNKVGQRISGKGFPIYYFRYFNADLLKELLPICKPNGVKQVTKEWINGMNELSLAIWYQDDGAWSGQTNKPRRRGRRRITFHTDSFDIPSIELLREWLLTFGIKSSQKFEKNTYPIIKICGNSVHKLWNIVAPYIVIRSKIDLSVRPFWVQCECGNYRDYRVRFCDICLYKKLLSGEYKSQYLLKQRFKVRTIIQLRDIKPIYMKPTDLYFFDHSKLRNFLC
jgi:hypothetical protein